MKTILPKSTNRPLVWLFGLLVSSATMVSRLLANPGGLTVQSGSATVTANGSQLTINASHNAVLNWQSFNIQAGETTIFQQPSASSIVWNRINDQNPSQIWGSLQANGVVVLMNRAGFYFGPNCVVNAAGLVVSTASATPQEFGSGTFWQFNGPPPQAKIVNFGQLNVSSGGSLFLIADRIENHGGIAAPGGNAGLFAGQEVLLSDRPDGRGLSAQVRLPSGSVDNTGRIVADGGTIALQAQVVNQNGLIQADSVRERNGVIELISSQNIALGADSVIQAGGDQATSSDGGQITIKSGDTFADVASSQIKVGGGGQGGNGGFVEISAPKLSSIQSQIDGHANAGGTGGKLVIDPTDIIIGSTGTGSAGAGTVNSGDSPTTLRLNVNSAFYGFSHIDLQATHNISLASGTTWDLVQSTGMFGDGFQLRLEAGNDITIGSGAGIVAGPGWSVTLEAGRDFSKAQGVNSGIGNITFSGTSSLETQDGQISLLAGNNITVNGGFVRTVGGGSIEVTAVAGNVNSGTRANGFNFRPDGYVVDTDLGGISTGNGGNVNITAGQDIISYLPLAGGVQGDAGSGAFGAAAGNVALNAGRNVVGHYVVRNGDGVINAGNNAGTSSKLLALSVVSGGWTVNAGHDILLQEVRNPNGIFNNLGLGSSTTRHFFDYSPDAYAVLNGGNSVQLLGTALPRYDSDDFEQSIPAIYPGRLEVHAGAGGIVLANDVTLFPSPQGQLRLTTIAGGGLIGTKSGEIVQLTMSDSGKTQYRNIGDFGVFDHASTPVHLNDPDPVRLNISGDMSSVLLAVPKRAEVNVGGNMINSRFDGQNLHPGDVTSINVVGDILNRNEFTSVTVNSAPDFSVFNRLYPPLTGLLASLPSLFSYNQATKTLTFKGRMNGDELQALLNLQVQVLDPTGLPLFDVNGNPVTKLAQFVSANVVNQLYMASQDIPLNPDTGYRIGGGGQFNFTARNLDLGATVGIVSQGPRANAALAKYFTRGADINLNLSGNLDMFSTTISSLNGGNVTVWADGSVNAGSRNFSGNDEVARGIFTVDRSDVTVIARGNINVNGSRIAAYDGGNVTVRSLEGNVDAGTGGLGSVPVEKIYVDPVTHRIRTYVPTIPGSGILATTFPPSLDPAFPPSHNTVGNILVETPRGNIIASAGGIVQLPLNGVNDKAGTVTLNAGTKDANGNVIYVGNIDATGSGVIGGTVKLNASGSVSGLVFARDNINISAQESVNVTALAQGNVSVNAGGTVSGTIIGIGSVSASGSTVDAALLSQNVSASGNVTSSQVGFSQGTAASGTSQSLENDQSTKAVADAKKAVEEDEENKKRTGNRGPMLAKATGRVTVILPNNP